MAPIFSVLFPVFILIVIGYVYGRWRHTDMEAANRMNMDIFIPALLIDVLAQKSFDLMSYQALAVNGLVVILLSGLLAWGVAKAIKQPANVFVPSMMFNNCGNLGLPMAVLAFGEHALGAAVVLFLISNLLHFTLGAVIVGGRVSWWRLLTMPVNLATITGLIISITGFELPKTIHLPITMLGQIAIPLMLVALGVRMVSVDLKDWRIGIIGAVIRPAVGVAAAFFILMLLPLEPLQRSQLLLFAALPPAVLNFIFAEKYNRGPKAVASIVLVGNALSVFFLSLMLLYLDINSL